MIRSLKIQEVGDFYRRKTKPLLLLKGEWLRQVGFLPNERVEVRVERGRLGLRSE